ncbi:PleD family two-component system response regulator [Patescibacteria group bacterium]
MQKILIVEDDKFLRDLLVRKLIKAEFKTDVAIDGDEAIKKTNSFMPDLILLDLIIPKIDGFEVLKQVKENEITMYIPVVILSNLGQQEEVEKGLKLGAVDYLVKAHLTPDEIVDKVRKILQSRKEA